MILDLLLEDFDSFQFLAVRSQIEKQDMEFLHSSHGEIFIQAKVEPCID